MNFSYSMIHISTRSFRSKGKQSVWECPLMRITESINKQNNRSEKQ